MQALRMQACSMQGDDCKEAPACACACPAGAAVHPQRALRAVQVSDALRERQAAALQCSTTALEPREGVEAHTSGLTGVQVTAPLCPDLISYMRRRVLQSLTPWEDGPASACLELQCVYAQVRWHRSLDTVAGDNSPALYLAHEFFDALPVHQVNSAGTSMVAGYPDCHSAAAEMLDHSMLTPVSGLPAGMLACNVPPDPS